MWFMGHSRRRRSSEVETARCLTQDHPMSEPQPEREHMTGLNSIGGACLAAALVISSHAGHAQDWPNRPVKIVVPFAAAGTTDRLGRLAAEELSKTFKQQFYVEN